MTTTTSPRRAAIYTRISLDETGEGLGVARQEEDARALVATRGWEVVAVYSDNSIGAYDRRKVRPGYDALTKAYESGQFDALVCWDLDRLTRQPRQLEDWIDAAESRGLALVTLNGEADLTTDGGRTFARIKLAVARGEMERKSARQKRAALQRAQLGRPPKGRRLLGYTPTGDTIPDEAATVRRIFALFDAGESLNGIRRTLDEEGVPTRYGKPWTVTSVRNILTNARYAGRSFYHGQIIDGVRGEWEPLVSDELFDLIQARLSDPARRTRRYGIDRKHLGSGLYRCDECGNRVTTWSAGAYRCLEACVHRSRLQVDAYVLEVISERLRLPDAAQILAPVEDAAAPLLAEITQLRQRQASVDADYDAGHIDGLRYRAASERVRAEIDEAQRKLGAQRSGSALGEMLGSPDPAEAFGNASLMAQRAVIEALCDVRLRRGVRGRRTFDPDSVVIDWRS
ncbi:recombinase family protein [Gordonia sp. HS-NH1]|uniref:recombinase family protein n=1 Tax=Gordonia sp. HS-NH1 TaxID=1435068 RepID=UPI0006E13B43|nr:recombinase family protein [Gordonia sp. HS-NH1]